MSAAKEGLTAQDLKILESYAVADNRELYFNYLALRFPHVSINNIKHLRPDGWKQVRA